MLAIVFILLESGSGSVLVIQSSLNGFCLQASVLGGLAKTLRFSPPFPFIHRLEAWEWTAAGGPGPSVKSRTLGRAFHSYHFHSFSFYCHFTAFLCASVTLQIDDTTDLHHANQSIFLTSPYPLNHCGTRFLWIILRFVCSNCTPLSGELDKAPLSVREIPEMGRYDRERYTEWVVAWFTSRHMYLLHFSREPIFTFRVCVLHWIGLGWRKQLCAFMSPQSPSCFRISLRLFSSLNRIEFNSKWHLIWALESAELSINAVQNLQQIFRLFSAFVGI
jgi:hypothetical protein